MVMASLRAISIIASYIVLYMSYDQQRSSSIDVIFVTFRPKALSTQLDQQQYGRYRYHPQALRIKKFTSVSTNTEVNYIRCRTAIMWK